ncbi:histidine phosphatase family protein [Micropruina sp.]|uniref:histidine phosphatase family protein n=1 Tax=Micropruina sp. TaxID=2737536 RepID=UPI0039E2DCFE
MSSNHPTTRIILARHGEAAYPSTAESDKSGGILTDLGQDQARSLGYALRNQGVAAVVCSELSRAKQTATIAADILGLEVGVRPGLHEYQLGEEPYTTQALGTALLGWLAGHLQARVLGGESGDEIARRVFPVLEDLVSLYAGEMVLVVMHGGAIIATLGSIAPGRTGLPSDNNPHNLESDLPGGAHFCLEHSPDGWRIISERRTTP